MVVSGGRLTYASGTSVAWLSSYTAHTAASVTLGCWSSVSSSSDGGIWNLSND